MSTIATVDELDRYFSETEKNLEIERVLSCFKLDPFAILELPYTKPDPKAIKKAYRQKSLMIHPDKVKHEKAQDAFALLKKAESELADEARLKFLLTVIEEARVEVLRSNGYKVKTEVVFNNQLPTMPAERNAPETQVKDKMKEILIEMELRRRRQLQREMEAEGAEKRKAEEKVNERKRKAENEKQWEESRDTRVNSWRQFQKKGGKKVKKVKKSGL
ncbi:hypothetical protein BDF20DRAFT_819433 [Mycotypha africana]|uniref:uncharacterized protein n=1 Tax=Mycotypha africana TaxID=64632 RepID=UPI002301D638|nr:uncharacterized protein BDF20DRAFT_819433 [Mycotypha africana]KAI8979263.1 hypothetical protein BDF20DRAFT_819433 [Mycotypha africana]